MIRKLLLVAAAIAMPASAGAVALVGTATVAGAAPTAINCAVSSKVTFASPGLSTKGSVTTATTRKDDDHDDRAERRHVGVLGLDTRPHHHEREPSKRARRRDHHGSGVTGNTTKYGRRFLGELRIDRGVEHQVLDPEAHDQDRLDHLIPRRRQRLLPTPAARARRPSAVRSGSRSPARSPLSPVGPPTRIR